MGEPEAEDEFPSGEQTIPNGSGLSVKRDLEELEMEKMDRQSNSDSISLIKNGPNMKRFTFDASA